MGAVDTQQRRGEIARRLKAGRWLAGDVQLDAKGKRKASALSPQALAERPPLPENNITASRIGSIERMERHTPPMELDALAAALGFSGDYFSVAPSKAVRLSSEQIREAAELLAPQLLEAARALAPASATEPREQDGPGPPAVGEGAGGG